MKKNASVLALIVSALILADQAVKIVISRWYYESSIGIIGGFVLFTPVHNTKLSWLNSWLDLGIGFAFHVLINVLVLAAAILVYSYGKKKYGIKRIVNVIYVLVLSGGSCSLIDKIFWGGSLDYIYLKGLFVFDLKDVYITAAEVLFILFYIRFLTRNPESLNKKRIASEMKAFLGYVYNDVLRRRKRSVFQGNAHEKKRR